MSTDPQARWAASLLAGFADAGVRDVVVSPGSRSTPLVLAAARHGGFRLHTVIDERAAAFFALGQARASGLPSLLICTSGSAPTHYYPAIIEAEHARLPLLVLSADRPGELQHREAPQTTDQGKLFGNHVRLYLELGPPAGEATLVDAARRSAARAVFAARGPVPGPVHLNAWLRKPLEPIGEAAPAPGPAPVTAYPARLAPDPRAIERLAAACRASHRGVLLCGPGTLEQRELLPAIEKVARSAGLPILADAASQLRFVGERPDAPRIDAYEVLEETRWFLSGEAPDLVLRVGAPQTRSRSADTLALFDELPLYVIARDGWGDPHGIATGIVAGEPLETLEALATALDGHAPGDTWAARLSAADAVVWQALDRVLAEDATFGEAHALRRVIRELPAGSLLALGNSLPIREANRFARTTDADVGVLHQRGASGIDGLVAGAAGSVSSSGKPVTLVLGDLSFQHDLGGLATASGLPAPLVVVVIQNRGGRLFEQLPIGSREDLATEFARFFLTRQHLDIGAAAALFGHRYECVDDESGLAAALARGHEHAGCTVLEVVVPEDSARRQRDALLRAAEAALADAR